MGWNKYVSGEAGKEDDPNDALGSDGISQKSIFLAIDTG
jgi:hypothetical protein